MKAFWSALFWTWVIVWGMACAVVSLALLPITLLDPKRRAAAFCSGLWSFGVLLGIPRVRVTYVGAEKLPKDRAFLIVANHASVSDVIFWLKLWPMATTVAKPGLFRIPVFGLHCRAAGYIQAGRGEEGALGRVVDGVTRALRLGRSVVTFPEGTRTDDGTVGKFHSALFSMAQMTGSPIVPVAISGTRGVIPKGTWHYTFSARVVVEVLDPMVPTPDESARALARTARARVVDALARHHATNGAPDAAVAPVVGHAG